MYKIDTCWYDFIWIDWWNTYMITVRLEYLLLSHTSLLMVIKKPCYIWVLSCVYPISHDKIGLRVTYDPHVIYFRILSPRMIFDHIRLSEYQNFLVFSLYIHSYQPRLRLGWYEKNIVLGPSALVRYFWYHTPRSILPCDITYCHYKLFIWKACLFIIYREI